MMFPTLFPRSCADYTVRDRDFGDGVPPPQSAAVIKYLLMFRVRRPDGVIDYPFQRHPRFLFYALNNRVRSSALSLASVLVRCRADDFYNVHTAADLAQMLDDPAAADLLARRCSGYAVNVVGSPAYWADAGKCMQAMVEQRGPPSFFLTLSAADNHAQDLHAAMPNGGASLPPGSRYQNVLNYPAIVATWFRQRVEEVMEALERSSMRLSAYAIRFEFQRRGAIHAHILLWRDVSLMHLAQQVAAGRHADHTLRANDAQDLPADRVHALRQQSAAGAAARDQLQEVLTLNVCCWTPHPTRAAQAAYLQATGAPEPSVCFEDLPPRPLRVAPPAMPPSLADDDAELAHLLQSVQIHRCFEGYCLKRARPCRFAFPHTCVADVTFTYKPHKYAADQFECDVVMPRNDPYLNGYHPTLMGLWRANMDIKPILDQGHLISYLIKYTTKAEKANVLYRNAIATALTRFQQDGTADVRQATAVFKSAFVRCLGGRDVGAVEACCILLGYALYQLSDTVHRLSLLPVERIIVGRRRRDDQPGDAAPATAPSFLRAYARRPAPMQHLSLYELAATHCLSKTQPDTLELNSHGKIACPVFTPCYMNLAPSHPQYPARCWSQCVKWIPWAGSARTIWHTAPADVAVLLDRPPLQSHAPADTPPHLLLQAQQLAVERWESWVRDCYDTSSPPPMMARWLDEHARVMAAISLRNPPPPPPPGAAPHDNVAAPADASDTDSDSDADSVAAHPFAQVLREDLPFVPGAHLPAHAMVQGSDEEDSDAEPDTAVVWNDAFPWVPTSHVAYDDTELNADLARTTFNQGLAPDSRPPALHVAPDTMAAASPEQAFVLRMVLAHATASAAHRHDPHQHDLPGPMRMVIVGTAGTGKSWLISQLQHCLGASLRTCAPTGKAAFAIRGCTAHYLFRLPVGAEPFVDLTPNELRSMRQDLQAAAYVILDEFSMLGQTDMQRIHLRLQQMLGTEGAQPATFGGMSFLLFGDPAQLPPIGQLPIYKQYFELFDCFAWVVRLSVQQRQAPAQHAFKDLTMAIRDGCPTPAHLQLLRSRQRERGATFEPPPPHASDVVHLFATNDRVDAWNTDALYQVAGRGQPAGAPTHPIARCHATHTPVGSNPRAAADKAGGLHTDIYLCVGARIMITRNICVALGLVNGTIGTVLDICYFAQPPPALPAFVLLHVPDYCGPALLTANFWRLPGAAPSALVLSKVVPIFPMSSTFKLGHRIFTRTQLPLRLCFALTVHKSQGATLPYVWLHLDAPAIQRTPALLFVGITRVRSIQHLIVDAIPPHAIRAIRNHHSLRIRLEAELRLLDKAVHTLSVHGGCLQSQATENRIHLAIQAEVQRLNAYMQTLPNPRRKRNAAAVLPPAVPPPAPPLPPPVQPPHP